MRPYNDHNVYILGAGFSADAGLPLVPEFLVAMRDALHWTSRGGRDRQREREAIERVLTYRQEAASVAHYMDFDPENIEELFSLASADTAAAAPLDADTFALAITATLEHCRLRSQRALRGKSVKLSASIAAPSSTWSVSTSGQGTEYRVPLYEHLVACMVDGLDQPRDRRQSTIITLNYDLLVDEAMDRLQIRRDYGLGIGSPPYPGSAVPLLKLHGSMNWTDGNGDAPIEVHDDYEAALACSRPLVLVPPTYGKHFAGPLQSVWRRAVEALSTATRIVVVGFSFPRTDLHFRYLLAAGLKSNIWLRKVVLVSKGNAGIEAMRGQFSELCPRTPFRLECYSQGATAYFNDANLLKQIGRHRGPRKNPR